MDLGKIINLQGDEGMRKVRRVKRILAFLLCLILSVNLILTDCVAYAYGVRSGTVQQDANAEAKVDIDTSQIMDSISMSATDSFGTMLQSELEDTIEEQEENDGYNVFSVEMIDNVAVVEMETMEDCVLVVGIYDEDTEQLLASGSIDVYQDETEVYVDIDTEEMPEYYYVRANLVESDTLKPLSTEYESAMYTKEMQDFLSKTTDDFEQEKIVNFDDDTTNNFAVYGDDVKLIGKSADETNEVASIDEESKTYVIENADDDITSLVQGDIFAYEYSEDEILIVKVDTITMDGTTATITGEETTLDDVFEYIKIDETAGADDCEDVGEYSEEGVIYNGLVEMESDIQTYGSNYDKKFGWSYTFLDKVLKGEEDGNNVKLNGDIEFAIYFDISLYFQKYKIDYLEFRVDVELDVDVNITGKAATDGIPLKEKVNKVGFFNKIKFSCKPEFVFRTEAAGDINGKFEMTTGLRIGRKTEFIRPKPKFSLEGGLDIDVFVGLEVGPRVEVKVLNKEIGNAKITGECGIEISAEYKPSITTEKEDRKHNCKVCVDGDFNFVSRIVISSNIMNKEKLKFEKEYPAEFKLGDWYWSLDNGKFGLSECPDYSYKTTIRVVDEKEKPVSNASVGKYKTDEDGKVVLFLPKGKYSFEVNKDGYIGTTKTFKVNKKAKKVVVTIEKEDTADVIITTSVTIDETTFPDENFRQFILDYIDIDDDGILSCDEIDSVGVIRCPGLGISDLSGIDIFYNLSELYCGYNNLTSLDVSGCHSLIWLECYNNKLTLLDVSGCPDLGLLDCDYNELSTIDISVCSKLVSLNCENNNLTSLDVSGYAELRGVTCNNNKLTFFKSSNCPELYSVHCDHNNLSSIDISNCPELDTLNCNYNNITMLEVSEWPMLRYLECEYNNLTMLDVSCCPNLIWLRCGNNELTSLCVLNNSMLEDIYCDNNKLTSLDVDECLELRYLLCNNNNLTSLDVSGCPDLGTLDCRGNNITSIDLSMNTWLAYVKGLRCDEGVEVIGYDGEIDTSIMNNVETTLHSASKIDDNSDIEVSTDMQIDDELPVLAHQSATTTSIKTIHQVTTADDNHIDYTDLYPNEIYNFYVVKESADDIPFGDVLTSDNLLYIKQYTTDENGTLSIDYIPSLEYENATEILVCYKRIDISEGYEVSISDLPYTGNEQAPNIELKVGGVLLTEGQDYELEGDYYVTDIGEYIVTISGIGKYEGSIDVPFKVKKYAVEGIVLNPANIQVKVGNAISIKATVSPSYAYNKTLNWTSSNTGVATVDSKGNVTALKAGTATITATALDGSGVSATCTVTVTEPVSEEPKPEQPKTYPAINTSYRTHIQSFGWEGDASDITTWKSNGTMSGTSGKAKRLEGINIVVNSAEAGKDVDLGIQYTTHCQSYGWLPWSADGDMNGTEGEAKRLEAIKIQLTGADKDAYDVYYRVHAQSYGWLGWAKNGAPSGTAGYGKRLEGIQIVVVKKGEAFNQKMEGITSVRTESYIAKEGSSPIVNYAPTSNTNPVIPGADTPNVAYRTHVQSFGWQGWKYNGQMSGTSGLAKRLEGININLTNKPCDGDIVYTTHVQTYGWKDGNPEDTSRASWKKNGEMSGTSGEAKRLEAICIDLTGEMGEKYDIYYRVHAQSFGWLGWACNGEESGTAGYAKRLEGIQIVLVPKGGAAPANDYGGVTSVRTEGYIAK